jgi:RNA polymerase sigma-70 factor (ECF subfamily)
MMERVGGPETDVDAFCREVWPRLAASLGFYCSDFGAGEELAQEALARAWARWDRVSRLESPEAWVYRVGLNLCRSRFRRSRAERRALDRVRVDDLTMPPSTAEALAVRDSVAALPERQRAAVVLRYFADLSVATTAEALDCAQGTVRSLTSQAIENLRHQFDVAASREEAS